jgi:hypothetical protein
MDPAVIIAIVGGLFGAGGIAAILKTRSDNKKTEAEAEITLTGGWQILYETTRKEVNELRERLAIVEANERECKARLARLEMVEDGFDVEKKVAYLIQAEIEKRGGGIDGPDTVK